MSKKPNNLLKKLLQLRTSILLVVIAPGVLLLPIIFTDTVEARPAQCVAGTVPSNCNPSTPFNIEGSTFVINKCYRLVPSGGTSRWVIRPCSQAPFTATGGAAKSQCWDPLGPPPLLDDCPANGGGFTKQNGDPIVNDGNHCYDLIATGAGLFWSESICGAGHFFSTAVGSGGLPDVSANSSCTLNNAEDPNNSCVLFNKWLFPIVDVLAVGVGVVVAVMIAIGGIQYSSARGDPSAVAAAKKKIFNALLALVAYGLTWSFIQFIVPGGIF